MTAGVRVWDGPVRIVHWALVALLGFSWWSAENRIMDWHVLSGIAVLGLVVFRVIWGFAGGSTARFANFVRGPGAVAEYFRSGAHGAGHNPLGALSVVALLVVLIVQVASGLFAVDVDGLDSGPLSFLVSFEAGRSASAIHDVAFNLLLALAALHVLAVLFYMLVRRQPLVRRMVTGRDRALPEDTAGLETAPAWRLILVAVLAAGIAWAFSKGLFL